MYLISQLVLVKQYCFINSHTLVTTYNVGTTSGDKTITGCTSGQPIFLVHCVTKDNTDTQSGEYCAVRVKSGAAHASTVGDSYILGTHGGSGTPQGANAFIIVPNATSVVISFYAALDDEKVLVYRQ